MRSLFSDIKIKDLSSAIGLKKALEKPTAADGCYGEMVCWYSKCIIPSYRYVGPSCGTSIQQHSAGA